jgi:hypothetical protein
MSATHVYTRPFSVQPVNFDGLPWQDAEIVEAQTVERRDGDPHFYIKVSYPVKKSGSPPRRINLFFCGVLVTSCPLSNFDATLSLIAGSRLDLDVPFSLNPTS